MARNLDVNLTSSIIAKALIGCMALTILCAYLVHNGIENRKYGFDLNQSGLYFFASLSLLTVLIVIVKPRPNIRIGEDGIHFRALHRSPIPWASINSIGSSKIINRERPMEYITFDIDKPVLAALPSTKYARFLQLLGVVPRQENLKIVCSSLDVSHDILLGILHDCLNEYGRSD